RYGTRRTGGAAGAMERGRELLVPPGPLAETVAGPRGSPGGRKKESWLSPDEVKNEEGTAALPTATEVTGPRFEPERVIVVEGTEAGATEGGSTEARKGAAGGATAIGQAFERAEPVAPGTRTRRSPLTGTGARLGTVSAIEVPPPVDAIEETTRGVA